MKLGFSIGSANVKYRNYCVLHTSICITVGNKQIGNGFYCSSTGAKVLNDIFIGDVTVGANAIVNKSFEGSCWLLGFRHL